MTRRELTLSLALLTVSFSPVYPEKVEEIGKPIHGCIATIQELAKENTLRLQLYGKYAKTLRSLGLKRVSCPVSGKPYGYKVTMQGKNCEIFCEGNTHRQDGARPNHPCFSTQQGFQVK